MYAQNISNKRDDEENVCRLDEAVCAGRVEGGEK